MSSEGKVQNIQEEESLQILQKLIACVLGEQHRVRQSWEGY